MLLKKDRKERLGFTNDMEEVFSHPFFKDIDVGKILAREIESPANFA